MKKYLHFSIFLDHQQRHGGVKRSSQLAGCLRDASCASLNPYLPLREALRFCLAHPLACLKAVLFALRLFVAHGLSVIGLIKFSLVAAKLIHLVDSCAYETIILETAPGTSLHFMRYLAARNIPYIAVPHNIEYLVPHQRDRTFSSPGALFATEVFGYRHARKVIAIGEFDCAILRCSGASAVTLPYFPTADEEQMFMGIRAARALRTAAPSYLLLGTVENGPTYAGVKQFLDQQRSAAWPMHVIVAGHGTEKFAAYASERVTILGSVSEERLQALLLEVTALLINQPQTSGFLTKIVEMNLCGIPQIVLSDYQQAKGLEQYGVFQGIEKLQGGTDALRFHAYFDKPAAGQFLSSLS